MNPTILFPFVCLSLAACAASTSEPQLPSAANRPAYAQEYPTALQSLANDQANGEGQVKTLSSEFAKYPDQLKDPPWPQVLQVVEAADESGRTSAYAALAKESQIVQDFFTAERDEITRRVAGAVQYTAKKKECEIDTSGTVSASLKDSVDKQLEKRLRAGNDAHRLIERYRESLGKANASTLEKQADSITLASYIAFAELPMVRYRTEKLVQEAESVKRTLDRAIADEQAFQAEPGRSASEKKASADRVAKLQMSRSRVDGRAADAQAMLKDIEQHDSAAQKEYTKALDDLKAAISTRAKAKP